MALDPYRILGLQPGASQAEIKRAYRQLAKAYHPDSAGSGAIGHFLQVQKAYEVLTTPSARRVPRGSRPSPAPRPTEAWQADPERAKATRERAGTRGRTSTGGAGPAGGTGDEGSGKPKGGRRKNVKKATFGSTTYDEAREAADATWSGASWYGPTLGEYWTVNPREYADPRKHGPEYLARARRPLGPRGDAGAEATDTSAGTSGAGAASGPGGSGASAVGSRPAPPPGASSSPGAADDPLAPRATARPSSPARRARSAATETPGPAPDPATLVAAERGRPPAGPLARLSPDARDPLRRLVLALLAWPPLAIASATAIGTATGCLEAAARCEGPHQLMPWLAQVAILGILLALPGLAAVLALGAIALAVAALPATAALVAIGANYDPGRGSIALAVLLGIAWLAGVAFAVRRRGRGPGPARERRAPVS